MTRAAQGRAGPAARDAGQRLAEIHRIGLRSRAKPFGGTNVPRSRIPPHYQRWHLTNLFRNALPQGGWFVHTVLSCHGHQAVVQLDALTRVQFERIFGRGKA